MTRVHAVAVRKQRIVTVLKQGTINKRNLKTDMTLNSDFDLDEEVFFMHENKVHKAKVISVNVFNNGLHQREEYGLAGMLNKYALGQIFKTKQDLLNSL